jgi:ubiquinone/menaquinone biosynthesis C-methylase UbiE
MVTLHYDAEATRRLLAVYQTPDVAAQREAFAAALAPRTGERVLDLGAGPGLLALLLADRVGRSGQVCGVDISEPLLAHARALAGGRPELRWFRGDASALPLPDASFDAAISTQVLEYVSEVDAALAELHRVLRPQGRLVVVDTDWDSMVWSVPDRARHARVMAAWEQHAPHPHLPRTLAARLRRAGFVVQHTEVLPLYNPAAREDSYSYRMVALIADFVARAGGAAASDTAGWVTELEAEAAAGQWFFSLNRYLFAATRC